MRMKKDYLDWSCKKLRNITSSQSRMKHPTYNEMKEG